MSACLVKGATAARLVARDLLSGMGSMPCFQGLSVRGARARRERQMAPPPCGGQSPVLHEKPHLRCCIWLKAAPVPTPSCTLVITTLSRCRMAGSSAGKSVGPGDVMRALTRHSFSLRAVLAELIGMTLFGECTGERSGPVVMQRQLCGNETHPRCLPPWRSLHGLRNGSVLFLHPRLHLCSRFRLRPECDEHLHSPECRQPHHKGHRHANTAADRCDRAVCIKRLHSHCFSRTSHAFQR